MPLQKYSLTPAPNAWDALLDYGADARQVYAHLVLGRLSERTGLIHCRRKGIERELGLRGSQLDAALVDLQQAGVASVSDLGNGSVVIALLHYLEIVPTRPNNRRGWILDAHKIPDCDAKGDWFHLLPGDPELPEYTGGRPSLVNHTSTASGSPEENRTKENRTEQKKKAAPKKRKRFVPPTREECQDHAEAKGWGRQLGAEFFDYFTADPDRSWIDAKGQAVKSWKQKMHTWSKYRRANQTPQQQHVSHNAAIGAAWGELAMGKDYA